MEREDIQLNFETDNEIDVNNLKREFQRFPPTLNRYCTLAADAERDFDLAKGFYEEMRANVYVEIKREATKISEAYMEARIETDIRVRGAFKEMVEAKHAMKTIDGYVKSLNAKKDMIIQLGADARKES